MRLIAIRLAVASVFPVLALSVVVAGAVPVPPVKPGLWGVKMSVLDADGHEVVAPEQAALSRMPPEQRARMAEAMKARGLSLPDANGATKACLTKDTFESGAWQQVAADSGCTTNFSTQSASTWKWPSSCPTMKSESDGETVFTNAENYKTKLTTTATVMGKTKTSTRMLQGKWLGADCGDIKPLAPPAARK